MTNGININAEEFKKLNKDDRDTIIFENLQKILDRQQDFIEMFDKHTRDDAFHQRITYWTFVGIIALFGLGKGFGLI